MPPPYSVVSKDQRVSLIQSVHLPINKCLVSISILVTLLQSMQELLSLE